MFYIKIFMPPLSLMALIFLTSSLPGDVEHGALNFMLMLKPTLQNSLHVPLFGTLQYLWLRALTKASRTGCRAIFTAIAITFSYGLLDEYHQMFVPGRYASVSDVGLNLLGILIGTGLFVYIGRQKSPEKG